MRLRKYIAFAGMAVLMLCSCNEMENATTNKFTDNSYWTSTTKDRRKTDESGATGYDPHPAETQRIFRNR